MDTCDRFFFFSSRRRHTRFDCDWSSDVCSSDLFRNWRNNTTVRGELWRVLKYKCHLLGIRARQVEARGTTHTCPHCHQPAKPIFPRLWLIARRPAIGLPGCVVAIPRACGTEPVITLPLSI